MSRQSTEEIALIITGDGNGGVKAIKATREEIEKLDGSQKKGGQQARKYGDDHKKAEKDVSGFADTVKKGAKYIATAAAAATAALGALFVSRATAVEATVNTAQMLGVSTQAFMGQAHAASFLGIETQKYGDIVRETTKRVQEFATKGSGTAGDFFTAMNLDVKEFASLKPDELMRRLGSELEGLNQNQRILFLDALGGGEAVLLGNIIGDLSRLEEEAVAIGVALGDIDAQMLADSVTAMTQAQAVVTGTGNQISVALAPIVTDLAGRFYQMAVESGGFGNVMNKVVDVTVSGLGFILDGLQRYNQILGLAKIGLLTLGTAGGDAFASIADVLVRLLNGPMQAFIDVYTWLPGKLAGLMESAASLVGGPIGKMLSDSAAGIRGVIDSMQGFEITAEGIVGAATDMHSRLALARTEYDALLQRPPASEELTQWLENVRNAAYEMAAAQVEANQAVDAAIPLVTAVIDKGEQLIETMEFENSLMRMGSLERQIQTNLRKLDANATDAQREAVRRLTIERHNHEQAMKREEERTKLLGETQKNQIQGVQKAYSELINGFLDKGKVRFQDFFDFIINGWKRTYAEFASKNIAEAMFASGNGSGSGLFGGGSGGGGLSGITSSLSSLMGLNKLPGMISSVTDFLGNLVGYQGSQMVGPGVGGGSFTAGLSERLPQGMDILKSMGFTIVGGYAGNELGEALFGKKAESQIAATIGGVIGSLFSPLGAGIGSAIGSLIDTATGGDGKQRQNAGFFVAPTPGADPASTFDVEAFASGMQVQGYARRADQAIAKEIIETFRTVDGVGHGLIEALGGTLDMTRATLAGLNEEATAGSSGTFMGLGGNGKLGGDLTGQLNSYFRQLLDNTSGLSEELINSAKAAATAEEAIFILATALDEKRRTDEETTKAVEATAAATEALRAVEQKLLQERLGLIRSMGSELSAIRSLRESISLDMSTLLGATPLHQINATVTQQIAHIDEQRRLLLQNHSAEMAAERELHEMRTSAAKSLAGLALQMRLGSSSPLSGGQQLDLVQSQFRSTLAAAQAGDVGAAEELQELAQRYSEESQYMFASSEQHRSNMTEILSALDQVSVLMGQSAFDPTAANNALLAALSALDAQLIGIASGVNQAIISELQNIKVVLADLSPEMRESLTGAIAQWVSETNPGAEQIIQALSGIGAGIDVLPPEIAEYLAAVMKVYLQALGNQQRTVAGLPTGSITQNAGKQALIDQGFNLEYTADDISAYIDSAGLGSGNFDQEVAAIRQIYEEAIARGIGSAQIADAQGYTQQGIYDALIAAGIDPTGFADGGIATGPRSGHLQMLHGTEAVIPLPNGRSVPVQMTSAANDGVVRELRETNTLLAEMARLLITTGELSTRQRVRMTEVLENIDKKQKTEAVGSVRYAKPA